MLRHGSLFSGIGGFDLAAEWKGWSNEFHCEWNEFGQRILKYYWPKAISYEDITKTDFSIHRGKIDILTGGFPCQPYSTAGKRKGKEDERHLWPEMLRAIREIQPRYIVGENVAGLISWNGGMVFEEVHTDLENEGYEVQAFVLPAAAVGAPHRRDRVWFVAYSDKCTERPPRTSGETESDRSNNYDEQKSRRKQTEQYTRCSDVLRFATNAKSKSSRGELQQRSKQGKFGGCNSENYATNTQSSRRQSSKEYGQTESRWIAKKSLSNYWQNFPTQSPVCNGNYGLSTELDGITFPKWRNESIKGGGNAIVPQLAFQIFKAIEEHEHRTRKEF